MEQYARAPAELSSKGPMDNAWRTWKQQFLIFLQASGTIHRSQADKAILLMNLMGPVGQEAFNNFTFEDASQKENLDFLLTKFDKYFDPQKSEASERYSFFLRSKKNNESIDQFINDLKIKAKTCNFGSLTDSLIRDKIVLDTKDKSLRDALLREEDLDLTKAITIWQTHEITHEKLKQLCKEKTTDEPTKSKNEPTKSKNEQTKPKNAPSSSKTADNKNKKDCHRCGKTHPINKCPAWGKTCGKCNGVNHFTNKCTSHLAKGDKNQFVNVKNNAIPEAMVPGPFDQIAKKVMNDLAAKFAK